MLYKIKCDNRDLDITIDTYAMFKGGEFEDMYLQDYEGDRDAVEFEYDHKGIVKDFADLSVKYLKDNVIGGVIREVGEVVECGSPQFYNYTTDHYSVEITVDTEVLDDYCDNEDFRNYLVESGWRDTLTYYDDGEHEQRHKDDTITAKIAYYLSKEVNSDDYNMALFDYEYEVYLENTKVLINGKEA